MALPFIPPGLWFPLTIIAAVVQFVVAVLLAVAVHRDANERRYRQQTVFFVAPIVWALATFFSGGLMGAAVYWLMHHSTLSKANAP